MPATANIVMGYSIICLNFMTHIDKVSVIMANTQAVSNTPQGSSVCGSKGNVTMNMITKPNISQPSINNVQAVIVDRALNIFGIFLPPIDLIKKGTSDRIT